MRKPEELDALKSLEKLQAVVKTFRREKAFVIRVPLSAWPEVSDDRLGSLMRPFRLAHPPVQVVREEKTSEPRVSNEAMKFFMLTHSKPGLYSSKYYEELGWSLATGTRVRGKLVDGRFIAVHRVRTGRRGGCPELIELLPAAYELLGMEKPQQKGHGSFVHAWACLKIIAWLEVHPDA